MSCGSRRGFTMIEMIISLTLVALTMTVLVALFSGGMRVWQRSECGVRQEQSMLVAFEKMRRDLHQIQPFRLIPFKGSREAMEFPVLLDSQEYAQPVFEPGRKIFFFDSKTQTLCESEQLFRGMRSSRGNRTCLPVLEQIEKVQFSYLSYNTKAESFSWSSQWSVAAFPVSIKMELEYEDLCREQKAKKQFTISIPIGPIR